MIYVLFDSYQQLLKFWNHFVSQWMLNLVTPQLDQQQLGCLAGRSTLHTVVSALHLWTTSLDTGQAVRTIFVDFRKAFDLVDHNILLKKIISEVGPQIMMRMVQIILIPKAQTSTRTWFSVFTMAFLEWRHATWITSWSNFIHYTHRRFESVMQHT